MKLTCKDGNITSRIKLGQVYVERLTPPTINYEYPLVFIAGAGQTGTNFLQTPDGRPGLASYFLNQGYVVYLSDQVSRGRSPWHPSIGSIMLSSTIGVEDMFTATFRHSNWPQSKLHTQWPGTGQVGDPALKLSTRSKWNSFQTLVYQKSGTQKPTLHSSIRLEQRTYLLIVSRELTAGVSEMFDQNWYRASSLSSPMVPRSQHKVQVWVETGLGE